MDDDLWARRQELQARADRAAFGTDRKAARPQHIDLGPVATPPARQSVRSLPISPPMPASPEAYPRPLERYVPTETPQAPQRTTSQRSAHSPRLPSPLRQSTEGASQGYPFPAPAPEHPRPTSPPIPEGEEKGATSPPVSPRSRARVRSPRARDSMAPPIAQVWNHGTT